MAPRLALALAISLLASPAGAAPGPSRTLRVAAAANVKSAVDELARAFERGEPGVAVRVTAGASGALVAQLRSGAPFDVFLSADREYPRTVVAAGLAGREEVYAIGKLALWAPPGGLDVGRGLGALRDPAVRKVAIANPAVAPYGRAAEAALRSAGVLEAIRGKLVLGASASQAAHFAASGAADAALVPLSLTFEPELARGRAAVVPPESYPRLEQSAVILRRAADPELAQRFFAFVTGEKGRAILAKYGYALP
ncbi:MAG TPA: molybdate ABC transporter substrate-binding protein [Anaeromyxobacteraceae bacterium]|nr:molybdate ABC transporter substrate-binding protein [Anaeromyxobacteraceae bacterium]